MIIMILDKGRIMRKAWHTFTAQRGGHCDWRLGSKSFNSLWEEMGSSPCDQKTCIFVWIPAGARPYILHLLHVDPEDTCILTVYIYFPAWNQSWWTSLQSIMIHGPKPLKPKYQLTRMSWYTISKRDSLLVKAQNTKFWLRQYSMSGTSWVL